MKNEWDGKWGQEIKAQARRGEPTPRPWKWLPREGQFIVDVSRNIIAEVPCQGANPADGAFIVKVVNAWDSIEQLRERIKELEQL